MNIPIDLPRLKGFRYPREIIAYAVWAYHRLALSTADVEDLLAARGVVVSREAIRLWVNRFGQHFANCIRRDRPRPNDKWHMDEVVITIRGKKHWLWRAIDADGDVLDILVQTRRNAKAAKRFFQRLVSQFEEPRVVITDKLRSYIKPVKTLAPNADHRAHKGLNNAIEVSHRPTRKREKIFGKFRSPRGSEVFGRT
jgi:putative transposase